MDCFSCERKGVIIPLHTCDDCKKKFCSRCDSTTSTPVPCPSCGSKSTFQYG